MRLASHFPELVERPSNLAAQLWPGASEMPLDPPVSLPGKSDDWPIKPKHTCKAKRGVGTAWTIWRDRATAARMVTPAWRDEDNELGCPGCYHDRVKRYARQILEESEVRELRIITTDETEHRRLINVWKQRRYDERARIKKSVQSGEIDERQARARLQQIDIVFCSFPQADGQYTIIHNQLDTGGAELPSNNRELFGRVWSFANTPGNRKVKGSNGWGGRWQGARGDGRTRQSDKQNQAEGNEPEPRCQVWRDSTLSNEAQLVGVDAPTPKQKAFDQTITWTDLVDKFIQSEIETYAKGNKGERINGVLHIVNTFATDEFLTNNAQDNIYIDHSLIDDLGVISKNDAAAVDPGPSDNGNLHPPLDTPLFPKALQHNPGSEFYTGAAATVETSASVVSSGGDMIAVAVSNNRAELGKIELGDTDAWRVFNGSFRNINVTPEKLAQLVARGYAYTSQHHDYRKASNFDRAQILALDFDTEDERSTVDALRLDPFIAKHGAFIHTTPSHTPARPRARVVFCLDRAIRDATKYTDLTHALLWRFPHADQSAKDAARFYYGSKGCNVAWLGNTLTLNDAAWELVYPHRQYIESQRQADTTPGQVVTSSGASDRLLQKHRDSLLDRVQNAPDGEKYTTLRNVSITFGGYIAGGYYDLAQVTNWLQGAIRSNRHNVRDINAAYKTIDESLTFGLARPLHFAKPANGRNCD